MIQDGWHDGIVAIIDTLGVKSYSESAIEEFKKSSDDVFSWLTQFFKCVESGKGVLPETRKMFEIYNSYTYLSFGDTTLIFWGKKEVDREIPEVDNNWVMLNHNFGWLLNRLFYFSLNKKLMLRGAVSSGKYLIDMGNDPNVKRVLGPAINDAADWYEKADWIGFMATPEYGLKLSQIYNSYENLASDRIWKESLLFFYVEYDIPLYGDSKIKGWTSAWPRVYLNQDQLKKYKRDFKDNPNYYIRKGRAEFYKHISAFNVPVSTEKKYSNTIKYFEEFIQKYLYVEKIVDQQIGMSLDPPPKSHQKK